MQTPGFENASVTSLRTLWYFDPQIKRVVSISVHNSGTVTRSVFQEKIGSWVEAANQCYIITPEGQQGTAVEHLKWIDADTFEYWRSDVVIDGQSQPAADPKMTFKRVKV
ncbi:MAG: hypothetical protein IT581_18580 [Verrucomicrobiales bacterium]|nr:hypothetical protein [Verrucomicrobiales bacterium]